MEYTGTSLQSVLGAVQTYLASDLEKYILDVLVSALLMPLYQQLHKFWVHRQHS